MATPLPRGPWPHSRDDAERLARSTHLAFLGCPGLTIGRSSIVHGVTWRDWLPSLQLPAPLCGQGFSGYATTGELLPTTRVVTCKRCRKLLDTQPALELVFPARPSQAALWTP